MKFTITDDGKIQGPSIYMNARGRDLISKMENGEDPLLPTFIAHAPDLETAVCVRLQTDYAGWKGMRDLEREIGLGRN